MSSEPPPHEPRPKFDQWFDAPRWLPTDPLSAAVVVREYLGLRLVAPIQVEDEDHIVRVFSDHAVVRVEFQHKERLRCRLTWRPRKMGPPATRLRLRDFVPNATRGLAEEEAEYLRESVAKAILESQPTKLGKKAPQYRFINAASARSRNRLDK